MKEPLRILLIEDDIDDVELLEQSLISNNIHYELQVIRDGADALKYFQNDYPFPHVFVLDFNLPKIHGREILKEYAASKYAHIPLLVLTTSSAPEDRIFSNKNGATNFMIKPNNSLGLKELANVIAGMVKTDSL